MYDALTNSALLPAGARTTGRPELCYVGKRGGAFDIVFVAGCTLAYPFAVED